MKMPRWEDGASGGPLRASGGDAPRYTVNSALLWRRRDNQDVPVSSRNRGWARSSRHHHAVPKVAASKCPGLAAE